MAQRKDSGRTRQREDNRSFSATKSGPGRRHRGGKPGHRIAKPRKTRAADALAQAWAQKRVPNWQGARDEHGAYTTVGAIYEMQAAEGEAVTPTSREHVLGGSFGKGGHTDYMARRKWLAGISERRGY